MVAFRLTEIMTGGCSQRKNKASFPADHNTPSYLVMGKLLLFKSTSDARSATRFKSLVHFYSHSVRI